MACVSSSSFLLLKQPTFSPRSKTSHHFSTRRRVVVVRAEAMSTTTIEKLGVKIERNPPESKLTELGVRQWP
ncbi:hypothetical protein CISIN_1g0311092mg, partial [Citrus sinensis]